MTLEDRVHALRLRLFRRAQELGNVSAACREAGISRSAYDQLRARFRRYGPDGLHPKHRRGRPGRPPGLEAVIERRILAEALAQPAWDPRRISDQLAMRGIYVAPSTVYRALRRHGLGTRQERFGLLEKHSASRAGLLTERPARRSRRPVPRPLVVTSRPSSQASGSASTASSSVVSRASARSGRSRPVTPPPPTASPCSSSATLAPPCRPSSSIGWSPTSPRPAGLSDACSRTVGASSPASSTRSAATGGSGTPGPSPAPPSPTASWSASRARSSTSTGGSRSGGATSPGSTSSTARSRAIFASTITSGPTAATEPVGAHRPRSSGEHAMQRPELSRPFRHRTP